MKLNFQKYGSRSRIRSWRWLGLLALLLTPSVALADEVQPNYFVVTENDNIEILFPILDRPVITLNETTVGVNSDSKTYSADISDIWYFGFKWSPLSDVTSISELRKEIEYSGNSIIIKGLSTGETVSLFGLNGVAVSNYVSKEENLVIDLNLLPAGVYILSTKNANYKIQK